MKTKKMPFTLMMKILRMILTSAMRALFLHYFCDDNKDDDGDDNDDDNDVDEDNN